MQARIIRNVGLIRRYLELLKQAFPIRSYRLAWGSNYKRLQSVKSKYDHDGLIVVHHGVGSESWSADDFAGLQSGS